MRINFHKKFTKEFKKLPKRIQEKFYEKLEIFEINQFAHVLNNHAVHYPYEDSRSINISGDLRALYETDDKNFIFIRIGTHSELYK